MRIIIMLCLTSFLCSSCGMSEQKKEKVHTIIKIIKKSYPSDNIVEEYIEKLIEDKTGMDIDLSPSTPEELKSYHTF